MAYMSKEHKIEIANKARSVLKKYNVKATFSINGYSRIVCTIYTSPLDLIRNYAETCLDNPWRYIGDIDIFIKTTDCLSINNSSHFKNNFNGKCLEFLQELYEIMNEGNHDNSDIYTDYFDIGWYVDIKIGKWNKPYCVQGV